MLTGILASVVVPVLVDFFKTSAPAVGRKIFGVSVDEQVKLDQANVEKLKALAALDTPGGTPSQWVINLRASFRYIAAAILILNGMAIIGYGILSASPEVFALGVEVAGSPFGFVFGERLMLNYKPGGKS